MSQNYHEFLKSKRLVVKPSGFEPDGISEILFPFQKDIVRWACKKGKAAIFMPPPPVDEHGHDH